jgi:hypothetical protein
VETNKPRGQETKVFDAKVLDAKEFVVCQDA